MFGGTGRVQCVFDDDGEVVEFELAVTADVRDRVPAADVELGEDDAVPGPDVGHRGDHP